MSRILISACLLGQPVRYDGTANEVDVPVLARWNQEGWLVPFCPEVAGGLPIPRPAAEIQGGEGEAVLNNKVNVQTQKGVDVTPHFLRGARLALRQAERAGVEIAILKDGSPSCGSTYIYDGTFTATKKAGRGITAALLQKEGIPVFSEEQIEEAIEYVE